MRTALLLATGLLLAGCAQGPDAAPGTEAREHTEAECLSALQFSKCRFENDLAGGHPIPLAQD
jgi:hypothetical protein